MVDKPSASGVNTLQQLLRAQEVGKIGSWEFDLGKNILTWSDMVFSIFEIERGDFGGTEEAFFALIHCDDRHEFLKAREDWLAEGGPFVFEHRIVTPTGKIKWVVERAEILANEEGKPLFTTGTVQDVTDLKQAELERQEAELELSRQTRLVRLAAEIGKIGGWRYEIGAERLEWSDETARIHDEPDGASPTLDQAVSYCIPEHRQRMRACLLTGMTDGHPIDDTFQIQTAGGRLAWVRVHCDAIRDESGKVAAVEGAMQDITTIKQAEESLLRQARRRRLAGRLARLGSWRVDIGKIHVMWCEETAAIHDEPEGTSPTVDDAINYYISEHRALIRKRFEACVNEGRPFDEIVQIVTAQERQIWVRSIGEPIRDAAGQIVAVEGAFQDITDLIAARDEASELSSRLRQTLESMSDGFYLLDSDWRFTFLNTTAERLLQRSREELLGEVIWDKLPEAARQVRPPFELALRENRTVRFEEIYPPLEKWFEVNANPTPAGLAVYFRDITEHRAREAQLRLLETAVANLNDILLITDAEPIDGPKGPRIVYVNDAFERRTGFSREEVIGRTPRILQGPRTEQAELERIRHALEKWQPVRSELINYTKSGEEFWLELDIVPLADERGWFTHWIAVERDVTDRKRSEEALKANEERFRLLANAAGNAIWDWDVIAGQQWWSEGLTKIFGHAPGPERSIPTVWRAHVHADDAARVDEAMRRLATGQVETLLESYRFRRGDGSWAWVEDRALALRNADGELVRVLGALTDVSERRELERQLRQSQKLEAIGQLTGGIAHDFNNMLAVIMGNAELLSEELGDQQVLQDMAGEVISAARRGAELTQRMLAFARKQVLDPVVTNLNTATQSMVPLLKRGLGEKVEIDVVLSDGLWLVEVDPGQLESALMNLAINARDAMSAGGKLTIETYNTVIDAETARAAEIKEGRFAVLAVSDTGCGISRENIERVLEPFFSTKSHGSGLGLPMIFGFVKQSGGHLKIYSEINEGTTVKLYFPQAADGAKETSKKSAVTDMPRGRGELVLVVEDDPDVRRNVVSMVRSLDYGVLEAGNAAAALDLLDRHTAIALLFTDVVMPGGMNGRELADAALRRRPDLRIIFTSGYTEDAIVHQGRLDPGVELLSKPYRRQELAAMLRTALVRPREAW